MRTPRRHRLVLPLVIAAAAAIPFARSLLQAQVMVCYVEWCIPKGTGESCVVKQVPCPSDS
ncbi:MAG TPA: hypothetical protein VF006_13900 [Longimicrobium sp.]